MYAVTANETVKYKFFVQCDFKFVIKKFIVEITKILIHTMIDPG